MEKTHVIPGLSDMVFYFRSKEVLALLKKALIKPHLQHSYQLFEEIWDQTVKSEQLRGKKKVLLRWINRTESLPLQKEAEILACLTCQKGGYKEKGIVLKDVCAMPEKEDKLN